MKLGIIFLGCFLIFSIIFIIDRITTNIHLKRHQKEWDELKAMLVAFAPSITQDDLREAYINYIDSIECYYPRF